MEGSITRSTARQAMLASPRGGLFDIRCPSVHVYMHERDTPEVQTEEGKLYLFVCIDRTSKFAVTQLLDKADRKTAWELLERLLKEVHYRAHTILTDRAIGAPLVRPTMARGTQFAEQPRNRNTASSRRIGDG
jgi:hypothetical protein